jgi:hypothetical protein
MKRAVILLGSIAGMSLLAGTALLRDNGGPVTRTYYIAADEVEWDYAPGGSNPITGMPFRTWSTCSLSPATMSSAAG